MYWMTLFIGAALAMMYQAPLQYLISDWIGKCIGTSQDMGEGDDFNLLDENMNSKILIEEECIQDTKDIVELQHN